MEIDLNSPDAPRLLAERGATLLLALQDLGVFPLEDPVDLLLLSILPLAIKQVLTGDPFGDVELLRELLTHLDLTELQRLIR